MAYIQANPSPADENGLYICQFGEENCYPGHRFGPAQRDHYLIHFVVSGQGTLHCDGRTWAIRAGQGFLIVPGEETWYQADADDPWHYAWVGYRGTQADALTRQAGMDTLHRVCTAQDGSAAWHALAALREEARTLRLGQLAAAGGLLRFLSLIAPAQSADAVVTPGRSICDKAVWYMEGRFDRAISIQETADFVGLSRSQLYRVMKEHCGCSPKEMLLRIRMERAAQMLSATRLTLGEIAHRIGLQTGAQLGAAFRRHLGMTPGQYRKDHTKYTINTK